MAKEPKSKTGGAKRVARKRKPKATEDKGLDFLEMASVLPSNMSGVGSLPRRGAKALAESYATSPWLHAVTSKISQHVACIEYTVHQSAGKVRSLSKRMGRAKQLETVQEHALLDLMWQPNAFMDGWAFMAVSSLIIDLQGDLLWELRYGEDSQLPVSIMPIPAHWVQQYPQWNDATRGGRGAVYKIATENYREEIPAERVIRLRTPNPASPFGVGVGLGLTLGDEVDTDEQVTKWVKSFFHNNARPDFMVGIEGLDAANIRRAQIAYENTHRSSQGGHRPYFYSGKLSVHEFSNSYGQMQVNQLRDFERQAFMTVYGVPPEVLGWTQNSNRATVTTASRLFSEQVLIPRADLFLRGWQQVADRFADGLIVDFVDPTPDDEAFRLDAMKAQPYTVTVNEWRHMQGLDSIGEEGDVFVAPQLPAAVFPAPEPTKASEPVQHVCCDKCSDNKALQQVEFNKTFTELLSAAQLQVLNNILDTNVVPQPLQEFLMPEVAKTTQTFFDDTSQNLNLGVSFDKFNPAVVEYMENLGGVRIDEMVDTSKEELRETLAQGISRGESTEELAQRVQEITGDPEKWRSERVARTETIRASNFGQQHAWGESDAVDAKKWLATESLWDTVRDAHKVLHEQAPIPTDQPFSIAGATAMYPGDFGVAALDINCRCTMIPIIEEQEASMSETAKLDRVYSIAKTFIEETETAEQRTARAVRQAWGEWEEGLLLDVAELPPYVTNE